MAGFFSPGKSGSASEYACPDGPRMRAGVTAYVDAVPSRLAYFFKRASNAFATPSADAGFCPVISSRSTTTCAAQFGPLR
jgi:hypothetical protein